jgi:hypothetical protein
MKMTLEHCGIVATVSTPNDDADLTEILCLVGGLLRSAGFSFNGEVGIVNPEEYDDRDEQREETE